MDLQKPKRRRGLILTLEGCRKLQDAKCEFENQENLGDRYTLEELSERTGLAPRTVAKILNREAGVDKRTLELVFRAFNLQLDKGDYSKPENNFEEVEEIKDATPAHQDLSEAVDVSIFHGRLEELSKLEHWIVNQRCRFVALLGMGGIGKTALAAKLTEQIKERFEYVIWRSLHNAPPVKEILTSLLHFLSNQQEANTDLSESLENRVSRLIDYLRSSRCLLILDNAEAILSSGGRAGYYRQGYEGYGELLKRVGESLHQSCLVLTSREKPKEVASLEGNTLLVRSFRLNGLKQVEGQEIFKAKGLLKAENESRVLIEQYAGNPLALKIVATTIQELFDGNISEFLQQGAVVFGDIRDLLEQQFERLSDLEKEMMYWLAINREPVSISELREDILSPVSHPKLLEALEALTRRSMMEKSVTLFTLQPVVTEYISDLLIECVAEEIKTQRIKIFRSHALLKAQAKDYVRETQVRLILKPITDKLLTIFKDKSNIENRLTHILSPLRGQSSLETGYAGGNAINLLRQLQVDLRGHDFSYLTVWQAYLQGVNLYQVNFIHADLAKSVFTKILGSVLSVAFSPDGKLLATGSADSEIRLWQVAHGKQLLTYKGQMGCIQSVALSDNNAECNANLWNLSPIEDRKTLEGHTDWVWSVAFSPDGQILASGSSDKMVKLWDVSTGQCLRTLQGDGNWVWSVVFSPDGQILASSGDDKTVKLWDVSTGQCLRTLQGHIDRVTSVAFSPVGDTLLQGIGQILASGSSDKTVKLWDVSTGECLRTLQEHSNWVWSVAFSSDGYMLASASTDQTVKLWKISTGQVLRTLQGHSSGVRSVAFAGANYTNSQTLASGSPDGTVKLWDVSTGQCFKTLQGHSSGVWSVAFSPIGDSLPQGTGQTLASGGNDQTVKLWDVSTGQCLRTWQGHSSGVWSVAFSPDGHMVANGSEDRTIKLWDVCTGQILRTLQGHTDTVNSVAFSPDGQTLASGSDDRAVKLWDVSTGHCLQTLQGQAGIVGSVTFSPDGQALAIRVANQIVRVWDVTTREYSKTLQSPTNWVLSITFSFDGQTLASGSPDGTVNLWDVSTGQCFKTLQGHSSGVWSVAFSPDGQTLASGGNDQTVKLWDVSTGQCLRTWQAYSSGVWSVAFSPDGQTLASGGNDQTVKLWDVSTGQCLRTWQAHTKCTRSLVFSPSGQTLASGSDDETIKLWDIKTGECLKTFRSEGPYKGMNITGSTGLNEAQKSMLKALGAIES